MDDHHRNWESERASDRRGGWRQRPPPCALHRPVAAFVMIAVLCAAGVGCTRTPTSVSTSADSARSAPTTAPAAFAEGYLVELAPGQTPDELRTAAGRVFTRVVSIEPLFPDVRPDDDPFALGSIYRVSVADAPSGESPWDRAYRLRDAGGFIRVEPDTRDTVLEAQRRAAAIACLAAPALDCTSQPTARACDASWSLREMHVDGARALQPPPGGKPLGEGVRICHPDTGWTEHVDLDSSRIDRSASLNLLEGGTDARDPLGYSGNPGHGTATGSVLVSDGGFGDNGGTTAPGVVVGLAPRATLVPIRTFNSVVRVLDSDVARAVRHASTARCDVISMSLGGRLFFGLERAINDAVHRDAIVVSASGNCVGFVVAPASYDNAIAVAATNAEGKPWKGSSKGRAIDIAAPGEDVHVARASSGAGTLAAPGNGTSFATAAVAGAAADWIAFHGRPAIKAAQGNLSRQDLFRRVARQTARTPPGWDRQRYGAGILDLHALLRHPLGAPRTELREPPRDDTVALLSRMFDRDPARVRDGLSRMLGRPDDLDTQLQRFGGELLELAARDPEAFLTALDPEPGAFAPAARSLQSRASRTLAARLQPGGAP